MRTLALAAMAVCVGLIVAAPAEARPWADPAGRFTADLPSGWAVTNRSTPTFTYVILGSAANECHIVAQPNTVSASAAPRNVRYTAGQESLMDRDKWVQLANSVSPLFPNNSAEYISHSVDSSGFWPVQRAELRSPDGLVHAGMQIRPGIDIFAYCMTYSGDDPVETYNAFISSLGHTNDAQWRAEIEAAAPAAQ